jgi:flagellar biosynthesis GTPase FlhF
VGNLACNLVKVGITVNAVSGPITEPHWENTIMPKIPEDSEFLNFIKTHAEKYKDVCGWGILLDEWTDEQILTARGGPQPLFKSVVTVSKQLEALQKERDKEAIAARKEAREAQKNMSTEDMEEEKARRRFDRQEKKANRLLELQKKKNETKEQRSARKTERQESKAKERQAKKEQRDARKREEEDEASSKPVGEASAETTRAASTTARRLIRSRNGGEAAAS